MKSKINPFGRKTAKVVPVGNLDTGIIYLTKKGYITPKENPVGAQEAAKKSVELVVIVKSAKKRLMDALQIDEETADLKLFGKKLEDGTEISPEVNIFDYLDKDEQIRFIVLQNDLENRIKVATIFIQQRLVYHVKVAFDTTGETNTIGLESTNYPLVPGNQIKFDNFTVKVAKPSDAGSEVLTVESLPFSLSKGDVGYLLDVSGNIKTGYEDWTEDDTANLSEQQINAIFDFYQEEIGVNNKEEEGKTLENKSPILEPTSTQSQSNGQNCTLEFKPSESQIPDSNSKTLETAQAG